MKKIGITGNIGSGKTTVCKIFSVLGVAVFHADDEAKKIYHSDHFKTILLERFGKEIFDARNEIDKRVLAKIVFDDKGALAFLNSHIHPYVRRCFDEWYKNRPAVGRYVLYEAAILFESGHFENMDGIITVAAHKETRIKRIIKRDGATESDIRKRMDNQWSDEKKIEKADWIIYNDEKHFLIPQVMSIDEQIKKL